MFSVAIKEQRKRDLAAISIALLIHLLILGAFFLSGLIFFNDVEEYRGPVLVKLGRADAPDEVTDTMPKVPESTEEEQSNTVEESPESTDEVKTGNPQETIKPDESKNENAVEMPVSEEETGDRGKSETSSEESQTESSTVNEETSTTEAEEPVTVTKGSEEGNAWETTYEASPGIVGRSFGDEIYQYMPIPQFVEKAVFDSIKDDPDLINRTADKKRSILFRYYDLFGDEYLLKDQIQPQYDERPQIWSILAEGGYNLKDPEYKQVVPSLRPLIITFTVGIGSEETFLNNVQVYKSSGNSEVDEAVIYGFQKAIFSNSSDTPVKGRFTYRFE
ncbi:MAG: hypothetical protein JEY91_10335 [Spirochaetaceae bacterium]|nr:hypothetical protein [Spirochaetaceae bacterium]